MMLVKAYEISREEMIALAFFISHARSVKDMRIQAT